MAYRLFKAYALVGLKSTKLQAPFRWNQFGPPVRALDRFYSLASGRRLLRCRLHITGFSNAPGVKPGPKVSVRRESAPPSRPAVTGARLARSLGARALNRYAIASGPGALASSKRYPQGRDRR
jgi:hypothetical protein